MKKTELSEPTDYLVKARTSYRDLDGSISIDFPGDFMKTEFKDYVKKLGIDITKYHPIGIHIHDSENIGIRHIEVSIIAIDKELERSYRIEYDGTIPLVKFRHIDTFDNLRKYLYQIEIILTEKYYDESKMKIVAEISKEEN
jgi:hypothetical protein